MLEPVACKMLELVACAALSNDTLSLWQTLLKTCFAAATSATPALATILLGASKTISHNDIGPDGEPVASLDSSRPEARANTYCIKVCDVEKNVVAYHRVHYLLCIQKPVGLAWCGNV